MKIKKFQLWRRINYRDYIKFTYWSSKVRGQGDETLTKESSRKDWKKIIILKPIGNPETTFSMGFSSVFGDVKVSTATRKVKEGPFGMRMGPEDCDFFIASDKGEVGLEFIEYADINDRTKSELVLY